MVFILVQYSSTYQKALDTVNFKILLEKLYFDFGMTGMPLQLFTSYL